MVFLKRTKGLTAALLPPTQVIQTNATSVKTGSKHALDKSSSELHKTFENGDVKQPKPCSKISVDVSMNLDALITSFLQYTENVSAEKLYSKYSSAFDYSLVIPEFDSTSEPELSQIKNQSYESIGRPFDCDQDGEDSCRNIGENSSKFSVNENSEELSTKTTSTPRKPSSSDVEETINAVIQSSIHLSKKDFFARYSDALNANEVLELETSQLDSMDLGDFDYVQEVLNDISELDANLLYKRYLSDSNSDGSHLSPISLTESDENEDIFSDEIKKKSRNRNDKNVEGKKLITTNANSVVSTEGKNDENISNNPPAGVWVECVRCLKWRYLEEIRDPSEVDIAWNCALLPKYALIEDEKAVESACAEPEDLGEIDDKQFIYGDYATGSIVLAKMQGYPEWPSMIDCDAKGTYAELCPQTGQIKRYRVVFLDPRHPSTQLIPVSNIRRFSDVSQIKLEKKHTKYRRKLEAAIAEAQHAVELPVEERIFKYGYPYSEEQSNRFL